MGIRYINSFRQRYYEDELVWNSKLHIKALDYKFINEKHIDLNKRNYSSELWFMKLFSFKDVYTKLEVRRNFPILNRYFADFYFPLLSVVIEIDGKSHDDSKEYDEMRDKRFNKRGLVVFRIKYGDVKMLNRVKDTVYRIWKSKQNIVTDAPPKVKLVKREQKKVNKKNRISVETFFRDDLITILKNHELTRNIDIAHLSECLNFQIKAKGLYEFYIRKLSTSPICQSIINHSESERFFTDDSFQGVYCLQSLCDELSRKKREILTWYSAILKVSYPTRLSIKN